MTTAKRPDDEPRAEVLDPDEALRQAKPLPAPRDIEIDDITPEEWAAFYAALAEQ